MTELEEEMALTEIWFDSCARWLHTPDTKTILEIFERQRPLCHSDGEWYQSVIKAAQSAFKSLPQYYYDLYLAQIQKAYAMRIKQFDIFTWLKTLINCANW